MKGLAVAVAVLFVGCATAPHPLSDSVVGAERLKVAEDLLVNARNVSVKFEISSQGENPADMTGTLHFYEGNSLHLTADGHYRSDQVQLVLDGRDPSGLSRTLTKGPSASSHRDPPASKLREAIGLGIARMGLLHNLAQLCLDHPIEKAEGGFGDYVQLVDVSDGHSDTVRGEACRRIDFKIEVDRRPVGEGSMCVADATGLPIHRRQVVHFPQGDMTVVETYAWEVH
ncbi:MAG: hypothetical protein U0228_36405 [Myxococcaceae bacterium]